jgi:hypothetical protein
VAEFYLGLELETAKIVKGVAMISFLANTPINIKLPFRTQHTFELIDSTSAKRAVIASKRSSNQYINAMKGNSNCMFDYTDLMNSISQQCVTFKYYVAYSLLQS